MSNLNNAHEGMDEMGDHLDAQQEKKAAAPQPVQTAEDERAAWSPYLVDRADGVKGHYAIARWNPRGYQEVWNLRRHCWSSASDEALCYEEADELLRQISIPTAQALQARAALASKPVPAGVSDEQLAEAGRIWVYSVGTGNGPDFAGMRAALAAQPVREPMWQPIETAPKDGRKLLLTYTNGYGLPRIVVGGWVTDEEAAETDEDGAGLEAGWYERIDNWGDYYQVSINQGEPTHWMPLPAAPGATAEPVKAREPMTEREILDLVPTLMPIGSDFELLWFARCIERHHGITKE